MVKVCSEWVVDLKESDIKGKHPYVISGSHVVAAAIFKDVHNVAHVGVEWVLGIVRKHFWLIRACVTCRRLYSKPCAQLMADLPKECVEANKPPCSYVGIDVFGPFHVKYGRSEIKRYSCLFTCLSIRAVHVEILNSLDTESFLNGFRRFTARRGCPEAVFSDNGTNLVWGEAEHGLAF